MDVGRPDGFPTIQAAVDAAEPGDVVRIHPGTYTENLLLNKKVTLQGIGGPVLRGTGHGSVVSIIADACQIRGLIIEHSGGDLQAEDSGILVKSGSVVLEGNTLRDTLYGIYLLRAHKVTIRNNSIGGRPSLPLGERGAGLHFWDSPDNVVEENRIFDCRDGLYIQSSPGNQIRRNRVFRVRYGVHYMFSDRNSFEDNVFSDSVAGAAIMYSSDIQFHGNAFVHNRGFSSFGILFQDCERCIARRNMIVNNATGIFMEALRASTFQDNLIAENDVALQMFSSADTNLFIQNNFVDNLSPLQLIGRTTTTRFEDAGRGNYWSNYEGYDLDADRIGDIPHKIQNVFEYMEGNYPRLRLYLESPAAQAIGMAEKLMPMVRRSSLVDSAPLMKPVAVDHQPGGRDQSLSAQALLGIVSLAMLGIAVQTIRWGRG